MFRNYFQIALRNFFRNRLFTLVNMSGLSLGISAALVIFIVVHYEYSFDRFHPGDDRIFRVVGDEVNAGDRYRGPGIPLPLIGAIEKEVTGVSAMAPMILGEEPVEAKDRQGIVFTNTDYFKLTPYTWLAGSPRTAIAAADRVVLTAARASTLFPGMAPEAIIGRTLTYYDSIPVTVTGVVAGLDQPTDFIFQEFLSLPTLTDARLAGHFPLKAWGARSTNYELLLQLQNGNAAATARQQLQQLLHKYAPQLNEGNSKFRFALEPLKDIHLSEEYGSFYGVRKAHRDGLMGLMLLGGVLLTLACINFVNLTTAQAAQRAREIGIRKTMGGSRRQLIVQFLCETLLITAFAAIAGLLLTPLALRVFAPFLPPGIPIGGESRPAVIAFLVGLVIGVGLLSGIYPALVLSSFEPVKVLKGQSSVASGQTRKALLRKVLSVSQFVFAQLFLLFTLAASWQTRRLLHQDPGFRKDAVISIPLPAKNDSLKQLRFLLPGRFSRIAGVEAVSLSAEPPASNQFSGAGLTYVDGRKTIQTSVRLKFADTNYLRVYRIPLLAGRNVTPSDTMREVVINATYARLLGFARPADAVR
ncbi:MAG TPA: ABC transporter permease, partial [Bryobacteraceae bacterium]